MSGIQTEAYVVDAAKTEFTLRSVTLDAPKADEVLVEVKASGAFWPRVGPASTHGSTGICQTDIAARENHFNSQYPAIFGHETAGIVKQVGANVTNVKVGDVRGPPLLFGCTL